MVTPAAKAKLLARLVNLCQECSLAHCSAGKRLLQLQATQNARRRLITQLSKMKRASGHVQLTSQILSLGECMLLYLEPEVFSNLGELEEELHEALQTNYPIVLVHPEMLIKFNELIEQCPESLLKGRLLSTKALAWRTDGNHKQVCLAQVAKLLGGHGSDPDRLSNPMEFKEGFRLVEARAHVLLVGPPLCREHERLEQVVRQHLEQVIWQHLGQVLRTQVAAAQ